MSASEGGEFQMKRQLNDHCKDPKLEHVSSNLRSSKEARWHCGKEFPPANAGDTRDMGSIPRPGRSLEEGNGSPLQYSCLGTSMDRGAWWATVHGVTKEMDTHTHKKRWTRLSD